MKQVTFIQVSKDTYRWLTKFGYYDLDTLCSLIPSKISRKHWDILMTNFQTYMKPDKNQVRESFDTDLHKRGLIINEFDHKTVRKELKGLMKKDIKTSDFVVLEVV